MDGVPLNVANSVLKSQLTEDAYSNLKVVITYQKITDISLNISGEDIIRDRMLRKRKLNFIMTNAASSGSFDIQVMK